MNSNIFVQYFIMALYIHNLKEAFFAFRVCQLIFTFLKRSARGVAGLLQINNYYRRNTCTIR